MNVEKIKKDVLIKTIEDESKEELPSPEDLNKEEKNNNQQTTIFRQLASDFYKKQPYFFDSSKVWWVWNKLKYCWEVKDEIDIMNKFDKYFVQESEKSNIKNGILEALKKCGRIKQPKEIKKSWVQFKNKIYDITNEEIFESTPEYFVANPIPWEIGESEDTPTINKLFSTWVSEEDIPKLYELIAFSSVPEMFIHSFHFLYSPPGMGKGTYVNILLNFIGRDNAVSTSMSRINANPRFETCNWHKKLLITMSEVSNVNDLKNSGLINQASGGDPLRGEVKGSAVGFDFVNYGKFIYPTNKLLKIDPEDGFGRRVRIIKFKTRFEREKDVLSEIADREYNNLAKKCLRIAKELYKERRFTGDVDISERMSNYQEESKTPLERFIDTYCDTEDFEGKVLLDEFFSKYSNYLKKQGKKINKSLLGKELKKLGWETKRIFKQQEQNSLDGFQKRELENYILGIKFCIKGINGNTQYPLSPYEENNRELSDTPDTPDTKEQSQRDLLDKKPKVVKYGDKKPDNSQLNAKAGGKTDGI